MTRVRYLVMIVALISLTACSNTDSSQDSKVPGDQLTESGWSSDLQTDCDNFITSRDQEL